MRIRFTSPHPKDFPVGLLELIRSRPNICKSIHIPVQSGSSYILERMRRGYTREAYLDLISQIRDILPECSLSSDFIVGFCGEREEDHQDTLSLVRAVGYDQAFMFAYSLREKTHAHRNYEDDVPAGVKKRRLQELIETFHQSSSQKNLNEVGSFQLVLIEGTSKRSEQELQGRTDTNKRVVFPNGLFPNSIQQYLNDKFQSDNNNNNNNNNNNQNNQNNDENHNLSPLKVGDYVLVRIDSSTSISFRGTALCKTTITEHHTQRLSLPTLVKNVSGFNRSTATSSLES
eukprot:TRINITY_DN5095_c0_g1_i1.p1 TRINITY_DN5095_c0_g1~~TRINITY_DN5095_c0_g1_i1.p1  ORF type:complete len:314 (-),score=83.44 TRINITY_DN5095_c0_g1_i1:44-907(-)